MADSNKSGQTIRITIPADRLGVLEAGKKAGPLPENAPTIRPALQNKLGPAEFSIYQQLMECNYDAVMVTDWNGSIVDGNIRVSEFFQYQAAELVGINITNVIYGFDSAVLDQIRDNLNNSRFTFIEAYCFRKDKTAFPAEIATGKLTLGRENHLCFFVRDISLRKKAEEALDKTRAQLARVERLELAGSVAGHIAHDFNNLLTPLLVYPGFIKEQLPADSQAWQDLTVIEKTAQQIADINQQLLALSRRGYFEQTVLGINDIIEDVVALLTRGGLASGVSIRVELAPDLFRIKGASEQLLRVIQNLCQNAIDAMAESGTLTIETHNVYLEAPLKNHPSMSIGDYIIVRLTDTGHGIPENIQDKIFDPFFTTKKTNQRRGSGLGLSVVHSIVKDHQGHIDLKSAPGKGSVFTLFFPVCRDAAAPLPETQENLGGTETILIVDDDPLQIEVTSRMLEKMGYTVLSATSGEAAVVVLRECKKQHACPALAVLDMIMGQGWDGAETYQAMKKIHPAQRAIILSGYAESSKVDMAQNLGAGDYLRKPVTIEKLGRAIRKEIDRP